jgi:tetratricopeptide (TPR) repeat protein
MFPLLLLAFAQVVTPELRQHVEAGLQARAAGDLDRAAREFQRVVELAPDLPAAHVNLGSVYFQKKDYERATAPLRRALQLNPELPGAQQMLGTALLAQGAATEAVPHLEIARADDLLGIALLEAGRARDAIDRLEAALLQRPGDPDLLFYLSHAHGQLSKDLFDRLRQQPGGETRVQQMLGEAALATGQRDQAEKHFRAALAARADLRDVHLALGDLYLSNGDYAHAEPEFRAEARMAPLSAIAAYKLGFVLVNLGKPAEAAKELERADHLRPGMPETLLALGKALIAIGNLTGAESAFQKVIAAEPYSTLAEAAHLQLSQIYRKLGRAPDADRELKALQELRRSRR